LNYSFEVIGVVLIAIMYLGIIFNFSWVSSTVSCICIFVYCYSPYIRLLYFLSCYMISYYMWTFFNCLFDLALSQYQDQGRKVFI